MPKPFYENRFNVDCGRKKTVQTVGGIDSDERRHCGEVDIDVKAINIWFLNNALLMVTHLITSNFDVAASCLYVKSNAVDSDDVYCVCI